MLRILALACVLACGCHAFGQAAEAEEAFRKLCPQHKKYTLDAAELAILQAVAGHFKRFEWSPEVCDGGRRRPGSWEISWHSPVERYLRPRV